MIRIKEILKDRGMTVEQLACALNISRQALGKQIKGKMLVETAERIAVALEVPMWQLFASPEDVKDYKCPNCGKKIRIKIDIIDEAD